MTIRALFLDLDQTLIDDDLARDLSIEGAVSEIAAAWPELDLSQLPETYMRVSQDHWQTVARDVQRGVFTGDRWHYEAWSLSLQECGCTDASIAKAALDAYSQLRIQIVKPFDDATALLASSLGGMKLAIITNGPDQTQRQKVRATGLDRAVHAVLISGELGVAKPSKAIFDLALEQVGVTPEEAIHVGDSLESDVAGAQNSGITAVWLNRDGKRRDKRQPEPDHEITTLAELPGLLDG